MKTLVKIIGAGVGVAALIISQKIAFDFIWAQEKKLSKEIEDSEKEWLSSMIELLKTKEQQAAAEQEYDLAAKLRDQRLELEETWKKL